jgi:hypothetical protein
MAARVDVVMMVAMRADRQILDEHLAFEAIVDVATRLATLKYSSWYFLEATADAFK